MTPLSPSSIWHTDRTRYMEGFVCNWKRLLGYHAFNGGLSRRTMSTPLSTGIYAHSALEAVLKAKACTKEDVSHAIQDSLVQYKELLKDERDLPVDEQHALITALAHMYGRIAMPWLLNDFTVLDIEQEEQILLPYSNIQWNARPDFVTRHANGSLAIHDFKTSSSWVENRDVAEYQDSVQMMLNAYCVGQRMREPVNYYYVHILLKGNDYAKSPLIYPYVRAANPPITSEDWQAYYKYTNASGGTSYLGRQYERVPVWQHRLTEDWIWEMPESDCAKSLIIVGPYEVSQKKINRFLRGLKGNEEYWQQRMSLLEGNWLGQQWTDIWPREDFQNQMDKLFPRTYKCYTYGSRCQFYELCHQHHGWEDPIGNGLYDHRTPHHAQEVTE